jgi:DNA-binding response OmpR family regulator
MRTTSRLAASSNSIVVLFVGPLAEDHKILSDILADAYRSSCPPPSPWKLETRVSLPAALGLLRRKITPIVLCDTELGRDAWKELLGELAHFPEPPYLIVTSRLADEHLWAEALNLGAYDVLAKPFDANEVVRVLNSVWLRRNHPQPGRAKAATANAFASATLEPAV